MFKNKSLIIGTAALASFTSTSVTAQSYSEEKLNIAEHNSEFNSAEVPCQAKVPENCPTKPIPKAPINPTPDINVPSEISEALQCLHFITAHIDESGLKKVKLTDIKFAEECLEVFAQGLME